MSLVGYNLVIYEVKNENDKPKLVFVYDRVLQEKMGARKMKEEEENFIWKRWAGKICSKREYNLTREMYYAQKKTEKRLLG